MPSKLLERLVTQRKALTDDMSATLARVEERAAETGDDKLTEAEAKNMADAKKLATELDERIKELTEHEEREAAAAAVALRAMPAQAEVEERAGVAVGGAKVRNEPSAYSAVGQHSWVLDALVTHHRHMVPGLAAPDAAERMERYDREVRIEQRDSTTTTFASLVPPQFLLDEFTINLRAGRPFANVCTGMPLPPQGMTMTIPRATAATTVSIQATQNTNPSTTDMAITDLNVSVATFTGRGVISRQAMERGGVSLDRIVFADLAADAARLIDQQALFGSGASGQMLGAITTGSIITVTQTATTGLDTLKAIANAIQSINTQRFLPPDVIVMHPRRWGALTIAVDTANRPLVTVEAGALNIFGQGEAAATQQVVGSALGVPIVTDPNLRTNLGVGTNQDEILVLRRGDVYLWEQGDGTPREFTFEQPVGPASVQLAVYGNAAFTAARYPTAIAYISGAGLVPPTF